MKKTSLFQKLFTGCAWFLALLVIGLALVYFLWYRPRNDVPLASTLDLASLPTISAPPAPAAQPGVQSTPDPSTTAATAAAADPARQTRIAQNKSAPLCGPTSELVFLVVAIDQRGTDYMYGLGDVIRMVRVDFTQPQVNVVALPRNLIVTPATRLDVEGPLLLNQAYLFGAPGMSHYSGSGNGAGSLAETIQYNFGLTPDHYVVVNFQAFVDFINAIGGIEVDLPTYVDDRPKNFFPAGKQTLNGQQALALGRIRRKYSDLQRIDNQTIILKAVFDKLKQPAVWAKIPQIYAAMKKSIITDLTPNQISTLFCLVPKIASEKLLFYSTPSEVIVYDWEFVPTMNDQMQIFRWDQKFIDWLKQSLWDSPDAQ